MESILKDIQINDEDINWVESLLGEDIDFNFERRELIKNLESINIQAYPGTGKTTMLVAKLAILAKKWPNTNKGICVLSHTNCAREEIENRLGETQIGKALLKYPHFVGTVHSFFDQFVALPWLRSQGYKIHMIESELILKLRWFSLPNNTKFHLKKSNYDYSVCCYSVCLGNIPYNKGGDTKEKIINVIEESQKQGFFTFDEMLLFAWDAIEKCDSIPIALRNRFPLVLIDEAQDINSKQWDLIKKVFPEDNDEIVIQKYGDSNQAIYNNFVEAQEDNQIFGETVVEIGDSKRFDDRIAKLANTVATKYNNMRGTKNEFSSRNIPHTIFLFKKENATKVIDEFGQLALDCFSDEELKQNEKNGCHVIGMVHRKKEEEATREDHFPKGIYDYWKPYDASIDRKKQTFSSLIDYFRAGISEFKKTYELNCFIMRIAEGMRRLLNKAKNETFISASKNPFSSIMKKLPFEIQHELREYLYDLILEFFQCESDKYLSKDNWKKINDKLTHILDLFVLENNYNSFEFLSWNLGDSSTYTRGKAEVEKINHYKHTDANTGRSVFLKFGSIHSVKGKTHLATLVLETYFKSHNMKKILASLSGGKCTSNKINNSRLKCQYVAMTRAKALLCLAMLEDYVSPENIKDLQKLGWRIKRVT
ncbi:MAG TPA: UvrD-helicase domain-containing protein [Acholeplasmataceae bacterium]|nr:UvrD-helicase domain-containing protein [Acholeplasmataceae bacterium]